MRRIAIALVLLVAFGWAISPGPAQAIPVLQLYIEGSAYDSETGSWLLTNDGTFRLWAIGNLNGPGGIISPSNPNASSIDNVRLSAAYAEADAGVQITLTPSTTGNFGGYTDPSTPGAPSLLGTHIGGTPILGDGTPLPTHGIFGDDTGWREWNLGGFSVADSPIGNFGGPSFPIPSAGGKAQINVYEVTVAFASNATEEWVHFDLYDTVTSWTEVHHGKKNLPTNEYTTVAYQAPFSHDATSTTIPEPASLVVWSVIGAAAGLGAIRRRRRARWSEENRNAICQIIEQGHRA